jgi:hypothetical protein
MNWVRNIFTPAGLTPQAQAASSAQHTSHSGHTGGDAGSADSLREPSSPTDDELIDLLCLRLPRNNDVIVRRLFGLTASYMARQRGPTFSSEKVSQDLWCFWADVLNHVPIVPCPTRDEIWDAREDILFSLLGYRQRVYGSGGDPRYIRFFPSCRQRALTLPVSLACRYTPA